MCVLTGFTSPGSGLDQRAQQQGGFAQVHFFKVAPLLGLINFEGPATRGFVRVVPNLIWIEGEIHLHAPFRRVTPDAVTSILWRIDAIGFDKYQSSPARGLPRWRFLFTQRRMHGPMWIRRISLRPSHFIGFAAFCIAAWILQDWLRAPPGRDLWPTLESMSTPALWQAGALTVASYVVMIGHDLMAMVFIARQPPKAWVILAAFLGNALGANFGNTLLTGGRCATGLTQLLAFRRPRSPRLCCFAASAFGWASC
ncbi:hypothetical protein [Aquabacterium sp. CECT 9606]|uniref:hypothetical protein n=1 Tax=Aquabacterium sp. CECT 9606 TaxID=2845822 RepID=UPI001E4E42E0|nr:hypothetical protein [Aquabacterium sp. CECT 9606]